MKNLLILVLIVLCSCQHSGKSQVESDNHQIEFTDVPDSSDFPRTGPGAHLIRIKSDGKYGFRHPGGQIVIEPRFDYVAPFNEGIAAVKSYGRWGYINDEGYIDQEPLYEYTGSIRNGIGVLKFPGGKYGFWNRNTDFFLYPRFFWADEFREGFCIVRDSVGKYAFINTKGNLVTTYQFDAAERVKNREAPVKIGGSWFMLFFRDSGQAGLSRKPLERYD